MFFKSYLTDFDKTINIYDEGYCTVPITTENKKDGKDIGIDKKNC